MSQKKQIKSALISVYDKSGLDEIIEKLNAFGVKIYSTGGTQKYIEERGIDVIPVEDITSYPSILGGRVKTLHPKVFGGILNRRNYDSDVLEVEKFDIPQIDLVIVDLYPFEETVSSGANEDEIIEKIDIGGIALIRAAAKNFKDVIIVPSKKTYSDFITLLNNKNGFSSIEDRKFFATYAFNISSHYDTQIFKYFNGCENTFFKESVLNSSPLRYGENPHQKGSFFGELNEFFDQLHGKALSYNNLLDVDAAVCLMNDFKEDLPTFAILKHNNACGLATRENIKQAYIDALAGDPISAFGGILISNAKINISTAQEIHSLFCEVVIAPDFDDDALEILKGKKNRVLLKQKKFNFPNYQFRSVLNGVLLQERDSVTDLKNNFEIKTNTSPSEKELIDLEFANKIVKHTKSNTIVLAKDKQLIASGTGQTSRVDALKQAIIKAKAFNFNLNGAVMASDAFFPFPDCVEIAHDAGITAVIQPGGSIKDQASIDYCNNNGIAMVFTGNRHFKH